MESALREPTQQQRELGQADFRGSHRLFRGVAGSGKSVMLALGVANTLLRFQEEAAAGLFGGGGPPRRVLVVCFNETLVHYLRARIDDRYGRLAWGTAGPDVLTVTHIEGLIRGLESRVPTLRTGLSYEQRDQRSRALCEAFDRLDDAARHAATYDAVFVDEAQDLTADEVRFVRLERFAD